MKRVLLALFLLWGSVNIAQPFLFANVIYHLPVLIDSNLNESIALVNLFPGNSSVSITNPDSGRTEVFTVQQRKIIGRKIALSPEASSRLGLGEGSIVEVRIVQLALNGNTAEVNPAVEYQDIIASPVETTNVLPLTMRETAPEPISNSDSPISSSRPSLVTKTYPPKSVDTPPPSNAPNVFTDSFEPQAINTIPRNGEAELFSESPSVTGLPPRAENPPVAQTQSNSELAPNDNSLTILTKGENLRIPLPSKNEELGPRNPAPNPITKLVGPDKEAQELRRYQAEADNLRAQTPTGDPFATRNSANGVVSNTGPQLSSPKQKSNLRRNHKLNPSNPAPDPRINVGRKAEEEALKIAKHQAEANNLKTQAPAGDPFTARQSTGNIVSKTGPQLSKPNFQKQVSPSERGDALVPRNPAPNLKTNNQARESKEAQKEGSQLLATQIPAGDPFAPRNRQHNSESRTSPQLSNPRPTGPMGATQLNKPIPTRNYNLNPSNPSANPNPKNLRASPEHNITGDQFKEPEGQPERKDKGPITTQLPAGDPFAPRESLTNEPSETSSPPYKYVPSRNTPPQEIEKPRLNIIPPTARPNPNQPESMQKADDPSLTKDMPNIPTKEPEPAPKETIPPKGYARPTPFRGFADKGTAETENSERNNEVRNRSGDLILTPLSQSRSPYEPKKNFAPNQEPQTSRPPQSSETITSIPKKPQIYFPTIADMNPPPSGSLNRIPRIVPQRSTPPTDANDATVATSPTFEPAPEPRIEQNNKQTIAPPAIPSARVAQPQAPNQTKLEPKPSPTPTPAPATATRIPEKMANLNNLNLPDGYYIQLASFQDIRKTRQVYERFTNEYKMNVVPADVNGKKYYRCLIGNLDESQVADVLRRVRTAGYKDAFVYRNS